MMMRPFPDLFARNGARNSAYFERALIAPRLNASDSGIAQDKSISPLDTRVLER